MVLQLLSHYALQLSSNVLNHHLIQIVFQKGLMVYYEMFFTNSFLEGKHAFIQIKNKKYNKDHFHATELC